MMPKLLIRVSGKLGIILPAFLNPNHIHKLHFKILSKYTNLTTPALFTNKSIPPNVRSIHVNACLTDCSFVISHSTAFNCPSEPSRPKRNCSTLSLRRDSPQTIIPDLHSSVQMALPIPLVAPVTTATLPCHRSISQNYCRFSSLTIYLVNYREIKNVSLVWWCLRK